MEGGSMDWRLKCLALHTIARIPSAHSVFKKYVTKRYFFTLTDIEYEAYAYHLKNFQGGRALEFGAGSNLLCSLMLSNAGASEVLAYDLSRIATVEQVNHVIRQLRTRLSGPWPEVTDLDTDLTSKYRIRYISPGDARATGLPTGSVRFFCSTSTLEHIPAADIERIIEECKRVATADATYSFIIDYHDHYASADPAITRVHFYRYSDARWRLFNPPNHYQNRLRHSDYERMFATLGLQSVESRPVIPSIAIDRLSVAERFRRYSDADLAALNGYFVLRG
jgi:hypothetical protein